VQTQKCCCWLAYNTKSAAVGELETRNVEGQLGERGKRRNGLKQVEKWIGSWKIGGGEIINFVLQWRHMAYTEKFAKNGSWLFHKCAERKFCFFLLYSRYVRVKEQRVGGGNVRERDFDRKKILFLYGQNAKEFGSAASG
jgi:hypothetical protein